MVRRIYVEKKPGVNTHAKQLLAELKDTLGVAALESVSVINRYDVDGLDDSLFQQAAATVFSEPQSDDVTYTLDDALALHAPEPHCEGDFCTFPAPRTAFAVEFLPGQFDQRADSAAECIQLISQGECPEVRSATLYALDGHLTPEDIQAIKRYLINPVESREASLEEAPSLTQEFARPADVEVLDTFASLDDAGLQAFIDERGLAMDLGDIKFLQSYFKEEGRPPTITEVKMVDTYWSDHCRHTTFGTELTDVQIEDEAVRGAFETYLELRRQLGRENKPVTLMDMGTIGAKALKETGELTGLDESEEINACTVRVKVDVRGEEQDWLYLFKNETHNHPTEIEPFGGAATCLGGAIRDPLSGRAYVYQAMRVTGAADPTVPVADTIPGKLPQRKLVTTAANGYSSYGNQIGLATGQVNELYHPGYAAKRMEIGAVVGATPATDVRREEPQAGDVIVLLGGRTGRDGIGGATGSSKAHSATSIETCGAEVQKGNPPVERKIQRLFRNSEACRMIKRCNDFGAGGVSVAIGELADGLDIYLDRIPKKYEGLDGTELAISESQERMAVALAADDVDDFIALAHAENLEATPVAVVSAEPRVRMHWRDNVIVDVSREFLASNGAPKQASVKIGELPDIDLIGIDFSEDMTLTQHLLDMVTDLNVASNKGLVERFDSTIGAGTVLMPFGGARQLTPAQAMVSKLPVLGGQTTTVSGMSWGFDPYLTEQNPFAGSYIAVVESIAKLVATGFERRSMYLTFQEYFPKLANSPERWGLPTAAVLGALMAQLAMGVGAIGGKDSMSGTFEDLDVPPTLVSFATAVGNISRVTSPEFKRAGANVVWICPLSESPVDITATMDVVEHLIGEGLVSACATPTFAGLGETLFKMCVGNGLGIALEDSVNMTELTLLNHATFVVELANGMTAAELAAQLRAGAFTGGDADTPEDFVLDAEGNGCEVLDLGTTTDEYVMAFGDEMVDLAEIQEAWESAIQGVFPYRTACHSERSEESRSSDAASLEVDALSFEGGAPVAYSGPAIARPRVIIPVFPGTNCEYDTQAAFEAAGADVTVQVIRNLTPDDIRQSTDELVQNIRQSQIVMLPGGFSGGDEPDGSAKLICAVFRSPAVTEAVRDLLQARDGLMLGICNGFQALVKLGLVPFGDIMEATDELATLTFNDIGRHQSSLVRTRVASTLSPWLAGCQVGDVHTVAISHGEGKFVCPPELLDQMVAQGQVATQYVDANGAPSMDLSVNPNGSMLAIEGITSPDGRVFGKMGHSERAGAGLYKNVPGQDQLSIFTSGVRYFL